MTDRNIKSIAKRILLCSPVLFALFCSSAPSIIITDDDNGKLMAVPEGEVFAIKLKAQLGTGYSWLNEKEIDLVSIQGKPAQVSADKTLPGGFEYQVFTFKALKKGKGELAFSYRQPWNKEQKSAKSYSVQLEIK